VKLSVYFTPHGLESSQIAGRPVLVLDVLRTTSTMVAALTHGARAVIPAASSADALELANALDRDDVLLVGERAYRTIDGFDLGNSPADMTPEAVDGKTLIMSTSNGTAALLTAEGGDPVVVGAVLNFSAAADAARAAFEEKRELIILCAGHDRRFALEDAYVAGMYARRVLPARLSRRYELNDGAIAARELVRLYGDKWKKGVGASAAARHLRRLDLARDVDVATEVDRCDIVPTFFERQVRVQPPA